MLLALQELLLRETQTPGRELVGGGHVLDLCLRASSCDTELNACALRRSCRQLAAQLRGLYLLLLHLPVASCLRLVELGLVDVKLERALLVEQVGEVLVHEV